MRHDPSLCTCMGESQKRMINKSQLLYLKMKFRLNCFTIFELRFPLSANPNYNSFLRIMMVWGTKEMDSIIHNDIS